MRGVGCGYSGFWGFFVFIYFCFKVFWFCFLGFVYVRGYFDRCRFFVWIQEGIGGNKIFRVFVVLIFFNLSLVFRILVGTFRIVFWFLIKGKLFLEQIVVVKKDKRVEFFSLWNLRVKMQCQIWIEVEFFFQLLLCFEVERNVEIKIYIRSRFCYFFYQWGFQGANGGSVYLFLDYFFQFF